MEVFVTSDVTSNALEVFAKLFGVLKLPSEFITHYIKYCIEFCSNVKVIYFYKNLGKITLK